MSIITVSRLSQFCLEWALCCTAAVNPVGTVSVIVFIVRSDRYSTGDVTAGDVTADDVTADDVTEGDVTAGDVGAGVACFH